MVNIKILKLQMYIPPIFFHAFRSYVPLKTKFENHVCKKCQKVLKLEPSYLVH